MASFSGWTEGILLSVLLVVVLGGVIAGMNGLYGKNNELGLGTNTTSTDFANYQNTISSQVKEGEASFTSSAGLTLLSSWGMIKTASSIVWNFIGGGWIEQICNYMLLPTAVAWTFRLLYFLSIGFIILRILFKVNP